jgi:hypothetical protein
VASHVPPKHEGARYGAFQCQVTASVGEFARLRPFRHGSSERPKGSFYCDLVVLADNWMCGRA